MRNGGELILISLCGGGKFAGGSGAGGGRFSLRARVLEAQKSASVGDQNELAFLQHVYPEWVCENSKANVGSAVRRGVHAQRNARAVS